MNEVTDFLNKKASLAYQIRLAEKMLLAERQSKVVTAETPKEMEIKARLKGLVKLYSQYCTTV